MKLEPGTVIGGKYRITRLIGDGGMGAVYEARHEVLGTQVALKFLHQELAERQGLVTRFMREARVSASIQSLHVTRVTDVDQIDGSAFIVMELLEGESLQQLLDRRIKLERDLAIDIALQMLMGLEAAHALGVVHRDLKPDNVFITPSPGGPLVKLLDFGIAKVRDSNEYKKGLTRPGILMGTPEYMAPEQAFAADQVDYRADIYSLGAILYEMLTGERPAYGETAREIVDQVSAGSVRRITEHDGALPEELADVVHRALDPVYNRRYSSAGEMRLALAPFVNELSHAGKLAATAPSTPPVGARADDAPQGSGTIDEPPLATRRDGVPKTLPPEDDPQVALEKGETQEAPKQFIGAPSTYTPHAPAGTPSPFVATPPPYGAYSPPAPRRGRPLGAVFALLLGVVVAGGAIAYFVHQRPFSPDEPPPPLSQPTPTTISPDTPPESPPLSPSPSPQPRPLPPPSPGTRPGTPTPRPTTTARTDAGRPPRADAGSRPQVPFPFPTSVPSTIAFPPGFPTTLPFPNPFQPPPAASVKP